MGSASENSRSWKQGQGGGSGEQEVDGQRLEKMRTKGTAGVSLAGREEDKDAKARSPGAVGGWRDYRPSEREPICLLYLTALPLRRGLAAAQLLLSLFPGIISLHQLPSSSRT